MANDNEVARDAWNANAAFWNERMGEGNDFVTLLVWPAMSRLLGAVGGEQILDAGCGNGLTSRRLAAAGARVVAFDFSEAMLAAARGRSSGAAIDYRLLDATDETAFAGFADASFDGAIANMMIMDLADHVPLMRTAARLLRPGGRFVASVMHPCFNNPSVVHVGETEDREGTLATTYSVKVSRYRTAHTRAGLAINGQPVPHPYFHRSIADLLGAAFTAGFAVDGVEEPAFAPGVAATMPLGWSGRFSEIPPVLVVRLRRLASAL